MFVRARVPAPSLVERALSMRSCLLVVAVIGVTLVALLLGLFVIDTTPHMPPLHSVGLTLGALLALTAQCTALAINWRDARAAQRRRAKAELAMHCGCVGECTVDVVFDPALPIGRHRAV